MGIDTKPIPGDRSQFDVLADGKMLFSKESEGRFPDEEEILARLSRDGS